MKNHHMMNEKLRLTIFYNSGFSLLLRVVLINALLIYFFYNLFLGNFVRWPIVSVSLFIIIEIFIRFSLEKIEPISSVGENPKLILDTFTKQALETIFFKKNTKEFLTFILKLPQIKFFLQKLAIEKKDVQIFPVTPEDLARSAFEIAKKSHGKYVTTSDIFTAYLLLTESRTNLLFANKLKEEDLSNINLWTRIVFEEDKPSQVKARFVGIGFGESLVWGWTPETKNYTRDLTFSSIKKKALIEGREREYEILLEAMQRDQYNNVLLVGETGTGKDNLVENFIYESYEALLPKKLNHRRFLEVNVGPLVAGSENRSNLETRLQAIISEVKHSGNVVLYIPEFQNLLGSSSYNIDLSGAIFPYLKDGKMPIIATMNKEEYKKFFENNTLKEVFQVITLEEPSEDMALKMLLQKTDEIEEQNKTQLSYKAVVAAIQYADKYDLNAVLPGTAVELLNDASNSVKLSKGSNQIVTEDDVLSKMAQKTHVPVGEPTRDERMLLLNMETEMHKFIIGQDEAVSAVSEAMRRIRAGLTREKPISFLFLGPTGVGKTETAKTLSKIYFGGEAHIIRVDMSEYSADESVEKMLNSGAGSFLDDVLSHPFSLILLDEFEKANNRILNLFLQVLADARLTDNQGRTISFSNAIIIATSNAGSEFIRESLKNNTMISNQMLLDFLQREAILKPELLNRFDEIVIFKPLNITEVAQVVQLILTELIVKMSASDITLSFDPRVTDKIAKDGFNEEFGARPLRRYIQNNIEDIIAKRLLTGEIIRGNQVTITLDESLNIIINNSS
ncbi:MAG: hypothetical protein ACD_37C00660G0003 [uncultured bacterium]|nr:MAG: hypothetical protein ACD_37C00660G0003 [uncultured bacterium]